MLHGLIPALLGALVGCAGDGDGDGSATTQPPTSVSTPTSGDTATGPTADCTILTYENFGKGFMETWCRGCHTRNLDEADRQGAPVGVDFDFLEDVRLWNARILARATTEPPTMPIGGGNTPEERALLEEWLVCGAPGEELDPGPCATLAVAEGDLAVAAQADADAFCASGDNAVAGNVLVTAEVSVPCLCDVGGDLQVRAGASGTLDLPLLASVHGAVSIDGTQALDEVLLNDLLSVGGDVALIDTQLLYRLEAPVLATIGGSLRWEGNVSLAEIDTSRLRSVDGDLRVVDNVSLLDLFLPTESIDTVGGDLHIEGNVMLSEMGFIELDTVGGAIQVSGNEQLVKLSGFTFGMGFGDVVVADNPRLERITGFDNARTLASLDVTDNPRLERVSAFVNLATVDGDLRLLGNGSLDELTGFGALTTVGGDLTLRGADGLVTLAGLESLGTVEGDLSLVDNALLEKLEGVPELRTVGGSLIVTDNPALYKLFDLYGIEQVGANLRVENNPLLPSSAVDDLVQAIGRSNIGGAVSNTGNLTE